MVVIDCHMHLGRSWLACYDFEIDVHGLVKIMDKRGIDMGCLSSLESIVHDPVRGNNEVAEAVREHPDRIIPFAVVSPRYLRGRADEELERCINTMGFKGIKLHPQSQSYRADSPVVNPIMEKARQYEVPVLFHSGPEEYSHPRLIGNLAGRFPDVTVIMGHTGGSAFLEAIWEARSHDNILLDTCGIDNSTTGVVDNSTTIGVIEHAVDLVGVERIVFGSDNPIANVGVEMAKIKLANLTQKEKDMILGENMARVLRL
jgi:predicted TIM-barrel fold metal-dependent hydrolase